MTKTVAFIPVRCDSKSIPMKNIKSLSGKPLLQWVIDELIICKDIDKIIVATDCIEIEEIISTIKSNKVFIYHRKSINASDTSTTESVMIEYIEQSDLSNDDIFILVQATSPFTTSQDFTNGIKIFKTKKYDSLLTGCFTSRFYWNKDGMSLNYDYKNRPRRQDFDPCFIENGAFYIMQTSKFMHFRNRLYGKVGIVEMPSYTSLEIDEPEDWTKAEKILESRFYQHKKLNLSKIKLIASDIDGVLTNGHMYYTDDGKEFKQFNTRDGMAFQLFKELGYKTVFVTSENSPISKKRADKLKIDYLIQGKKHEGKKKAVLELCKKLKIDLDQVLYIGDDINCKELLLAVPYAFCPSDAEEEIKKINGITVLKKKGGDGVIREIYNTYFKK